MAPTNFTDPWLLTSDEDKEQTYLLKNRQDLDPLMERIGNAHHVLLGEAGRVGKTDVVLDGGLGVSFFKDFAMVEPNHSMADFLHGLKIV